MPAKDLIFDAEARRQLKSGIDALANAVKVTLGPRGRNVAIDKKWGAPTVTHDGVTVAKEIELENHFQNMGAQMLKQAATKTNDVAGDGTTTATVLAQAIVTEGLRNLAAGANPMLHEARHRRRHGRRRRRDQEAVDRRSRATTTSSTSPPSRPTIPRSADCWPRPWTRSAATASSPSKKARA